MYWINDDQVENIIKGDGYVKQKIAAVGDVAIYRKNGAVVHSARVVSVDSKTGFVKVEGLSGINTDVSIKNATPGPAGAWRDSSATVEYYRQSESVTKPVPPVCPSATNEVPSNPTTPPVRSGPAPPPNPDPTPPPVSGNSLP